ncbi:hypothetical protein LCGC14_2885010 [marine sediment metagenome]|uniref:DUF4177 domain-containing protein n=1 Tax=marine sediment metagenome TaxID=412755 RepID=A0A0F8XZ48_9ZZZZ
MKVKVISELEPETFEEAVDEALAEGWTLFSFRVTDWDSGSASGTGYYALLTKEVD